MRKIILLATTMILVFSGFMFASTAYARTEVTTIVIHRGHHHCYPYWCRHCRCWCCYHRHPRY